MEFLFIAGHKEVIKSDAGITPDGVLDCRPIAVALLVGDAKQNDVSFFAEVFRFLREVDYHFLDRPFVGIDFLLD